jgi:hypothetical protein
MFGQLEKQVMQLGGKEMISRLRQVISLALLIALAGLAGTAQAQGVRVDRSRRDEIRLVITRIDNRTEVFRKSLDATPNLSRLNGARAEENINQLLKDFDNATNSLRSAVNDREVSIDEAQALLRQARLIDNFMFSHRVGGDALNDWMELRGELDRLAQAYNLSWRWDNYGPTGAAFSGDVRQLINRIETRTNTFRNDLNGSLDLSRINTARQEDNIIRLVQDFEDSTDRLRDRYNGRVADSTDEARVVLQRAQRVDSFMTRFNVGGTAASDWTALRSDLNQLALAFNIASPFGAGGYTGGYGGNYGANRLTGTFRLDRSQSDDVRSAADRATRDLPSGDRQYVYDRLVNRLESPDQIAIERNGRNVTIASTRSPQITFEADGQEHIEQMENGRTVRVVASLVGDQLTVTTTGNRDTDFNVTFDPFDGGRRLRVTRRLSSDRLNRTVEIQSVYDRTADVAQWNVYNGSYSYPDTTSTSGDFIIPNGTQLIAVLNSNLSTAQAREGDRFTMTVRSPIQYDGATIEGYVSNIDRGGRISGRSEMTFNFDRIRMRDGRTYNFAGILQSVRTPNGETVYVNNEGNVQEENRTGTTAKRAAIGTAVGAIIGAIAGGGKGAAIGAAVGAGAGAGSVYVQGRDDVDLVTGTELSILATGPR